MMAEYIDRGKTVGLLKSFLESFKRNAFLGPFKTGCAAGVEDCIELISRAPIADVVEVKHGRWIKKNNKRHCSICNAIYFSNNDDFNYCFNCGAKMDRKDGKNNESENLSD